MEEFEPRHRLAAILAADAAGYSRLMAADDRVTLAALDAARAIFHARVRADGGRIVDTAGDSVLAVFSSAGGAVAAAVGIQEELTRSAATLPFRIAVHLGDVLEKSDGSVYGDGVNVAARLQTLCAPGGVAVSQAVHGVMAARLQAQFEDIGEQAVKNMAAPVRTYVLRAPGGSQVLRFGDIELLPRERKLRVRGEEVVLGVRAFDLLLALIERRDRVVSRSELRDVVWPGLVVEENNLQVQVSTLRKLLGPDVIATIPGRGYRFVAPSARVSPSTAPTPLTAAAHPAGNLPLHASSLIGRDATLRELVAWIEEHTLVTIAGTGGIGKTTLALSAAVELRGRFRDGAWWVGLAPLSDPALLPRTIAQALHITLAGDDSGGTSQQQLVGVLRSQEMLLVLDNCEHVIEAVAHLAEAIAAEAPGVRTLATSQELLGVSSERVFHLDPLASPAEGEVPHLETHGAVALFVERAQRADRRFDLNAENSAVVADICRRLDGLPLAIVLAAARVRLIGVQGVHDRLDEPFRLLAGGARTALRRHQTMRATLDWSLALLKPEEQAVLRRLSVFVGGFSLALAQRVAGDGEFDEWAVLDALGNLVDKSLVAVDAGDPVRYRLLETVRAYSMERLAEHGERDQYLQRHAHALRDLFVRTDEERFGDGGFLDMASLLQRLAPELDNWRAALDWASGSDPTTAVALAGAGAPLLRHLGLRQEALDRMLPLRGLVDEERHPLHAAGFWLRLVAVGDNHRLPRNVLLDAAARARRLYGAIASRRRLQLALYAEAWSLNMVSEFSAAEAMLPKIIGLEHADDPSWLRLQRSTLQASVYLHQDRFEESAAVLAEQQSLLLQAPGEQDNMAICQHNLAEALNCLQRHGEAITIARSALERTDGLRGSLLVPIVVALTALGRLDEAWQMLREALPLWRRDAVLLDLCCDIAALLAVSGRHADAARVDGAAMARLRHVDAPLVAPAKVSRARMFRSFEAAHVAQADIERWQREGEALDETQIAALCEAAAESP